MGRFRANVFRQAPDVIVIGEMREEKTHHIRSQMQAGSEDFVSLDVSLANLYKNGAVKLEDASQFVEDDLFFREVATGKR